MSEVLPRRRRGLISAVDSRKQSRDAWVKVRQERSGIAEATLGWRQRTSRDGFRHGASKTYINAL
jgi:hypothetical protein